jgi:hypothetical protein
MNPHAAPFARFWWLVLIGFVVAAIAGTAVVYHIDPGVPPKLTERTPPSYTAAAILMLTSEEQPLVRIGVTTVTPPKGRDGAPDVETSPPGLDTLVEAANLLPLTIQSDAVTELRRERVGDLPGTVTAQALYSHETPAGGIEASDVPAIEITADSPTPGNAVQLVRGTVSAFGIWLRTQQDEAKVPEAQRIFFSQLNAPSATRNSKSPYGLALLVAAAVLAGFALLVAALHRLFPRKQRRRRGLFRRKPEEPVAPESGPVPDGEVDAASGGPDGTSAPAVSSNGPAEPGDRLQAWLEEAAPGSSEKGKSSERTPPG